MPLTLEFRSPVATDLGALCAIENATHSCNWKREVFIKELTFEHGLNFVALTGGNFPVASYLFAWLIAGELQIQNIATSPDYQRKGIASRLVEFVCRSAQLRGARIAFLEVRAFNSAAIALYKKAGFVENGIRRGYYADTGEDALLMEKIL